MADRNFVPGYGYVTAGSSGTSGGNDRYASGRMPMPISDGSLRGVAEAAAKTDSDPSNDPVVNPTLPRPTTNNDVRYDLTYTTGYRPPINYGLSADRQEQQIGTLPLIYRIQDAGDLREAYWGDPESRAIIQAAARVYYRDYSNYNDQWAEKFWQEDIMGAALNPGSLPPWQMLQGIFAGSTKASGGDVASNGYSGGGYSGGGYGGGGGGGSSSVVLTDPTSARGLLLQTMQGVLGRNPSDREYRDFLKTLNESEMANPRTVEMDGDVAVQSGGVDASVLALEFAQDAEDFEQVRGDEFFQTFMRALAGV